MAFKKKKKKNATLNGCVSNARANSESKLTFSESSFSFLQNKIVFCTFYLRGYTTGGLCPLQPPVPLPAARQAERVNDGPVAVLNLLFLSVSLKMRTNLGKHAFFLLLEQSNAFKKWHLKKRQKTQLVSQKVERIQIQY